MIMKNLYISLLVTLFVAGCNVQNIKDCDEPNNLNDSGCCGIFRSLASCFGICGSNSDFDKNSIKCMDAMGYRNKEISEEGKTHILKSYDTEISEEERKYILESYNTEKLRKEYIIGGKKHEYETNILYTINTIPFERLLPHINRVKELKKLMGYKNDHLGGLGLTDWISKFMYGNNAEDSICEDIILRIDCADSIKKNISCPFFDCKYEVDLDPRYHDLRMEISNSKNWIQLAKKLEKHFENESNSIPEFTYKHSIRERKQMALDFMIQENIINKQEYDQAKDLLFAQLMPFMHSKYFSKERRKFLDLLQEFKNLLDEQQKLFKDLEDFSNTKIKECAYKILGVEPSATMIEIKEAYRKLAKERHPDHNMNNQDKDGKEMQKLNTAYKILKGDYKNSNWIEDDFS